MFIFSSACVDAIRVMTFMLNKKGEFVKLEEIVKDLGLPAAYLAKTLKKLEKAKLLVSKRGRLGGVCLEKDEEEIKILDIILAFDGERAFESCVMGLGDCSSETPCVLHERWELQMSEFRELLFATNFANIKDEVMRKKISKL